MSLSISASNLLSVITVFQSILYILSKVFYVYFVMHLISCIVFYAPHFMVLLCIYLYMHPLHLPYNLLCAFCFIQFSLLLVCLILFYAPHFMYQAPCILFCPPDYLHFVPCTSFLISGSSASRYIYFELTEQAHFLK